MTGKDIDPWVEEAEIVEPRGGWVEFDANNSGGSFWLSDEDWIKLEDNGWEVMWVKKDENAFMSMVMEWDNPRPTSFDNKENRWLGTIAHKARVFGMSVSEAKAQWERLLGMNADEQGCSCCGPPHNFYQHKPNGDMVFEWEADYLG